MRPATSRSLGALHIGACTRIDAKQIADVNEQWNLDRRARFEYRRLGTAGRGVTAKTRIGLDHPQLNKCRKHHADRFTPMAHDRNDHLFLDEAAGLAEQFLVHRKLLETLRVHKVIDIAVMVEVLYLSILHLRLRKLLFGPERAINDGAGLHIFQLGSHEGAAFTGLDPLIVRDNVRGAVQFDLDPWAQISSRNHHIRSPCVSDTWAFISRSFFIQQVKGSLQPKPIAQGAESGDLSGGDTGNQRVMTKLLAAIDVR